MMTDLILLHLILSACAVAMAAGDAVLCKFVAAPAPRATHRSTIEEDT